MFSYLLITPFNSTIQALFFSYFSLLFEMLMLNDGHVLKMISTTPSAGRPHFISSR